MSYDTAFHGVPGNHSVTPSSMSTSTAWAHEARYPSKDLPAPDTFSTTQHYSSPTDNSQGFSNSQAYTEYSHYSAKSPEAYVNGAHGTPYHYGTTWDSATLRERYEASSWVTTSSGEWTATASKVQEESPSTTHLNYDYSAPGSQLSSVTVKQGRSYTYPPLERPQETQEALQAPPILVPSQAPKLHPTPPLMVPSMVDPIVPISLWAEAHVPVPPEKRSSYSELMPNVIYLQRLREEELARARELAEKSRMPPVVISPKPSRKTAPTADAISADITDRSAPASTPAKKRKKTSSGKGAEVTRSDSPKEAAKRSSASKGKKTLKELRKPSLACTFCRERKISCGRPPPGSPDPTCNQCARRSFKCTYVTEHNGKPLAPQQQ